MAFEPPPMKFADHSRLKPIGRHVAGKPGVLAPPKGKEPFPAAVSSTSLALWLAAGSPPGNGRPRGIFLKPGQDMTVEFEGIFPA